MASWVVRLGGLASGKGITTSVDEVSLRSVLRPIFNKPHLISLFFFITCHSLSLILGQNKNLSLGTVVTPHKQTPSRRIPRRRRQPNTV